MKCEVSGQFKDIKYCVDELSEDSDLSDSDKYIRLGNNLKGQYVFSPAHSVILYHNQINMLPSVVIENQYISNMFYNKFDFIIEIDISVSLSL